MSDTVAKMGSDGVKIEKATVAAYTIPTDAPEADGTISWDSTTLVLVTLEGGGQKGIGYTYATIATATLIHTTLLGLVLHQNAMNIPAITGSLTRQVRNSGTCGISMMAVSAVDNALWDLKAKLLQLPLCSLLGARRDEMLIYGSGGFTTYDQQQLQQQLGGWAQDGIKYVKMKIGTHPGQDVDRVKQARDAIGIDTALMVDANGAYTVKQALAKAEAFTAYGVTWFEEPVSSDNVNGLRFIKEHAPVTIDIAAGEYGYDLPYFQVMLQAGAVDILQADATRCGGFSGFLSAAVVCDSYQLPFSSHCAPYLHLHAALAAPRFFIAEYFHDHARIEHMLFDGTSPPVAGALRPDLSRPGMGLEFKQQDAEKFKV